MATPAPVVVNGDTNLILINSRDLTANQSAVVLLSSIQTPGRVVTVRDSVGFLSTPQTILLSTITGVKFADGTSSIRITQPFGYLTVTSRDPTSWNLTNSFGFPQNETIASAAALTTSSVLTRDLYSSRYVSTPYINLLSLDSYSTSAFLGPSYISTLVVGPPPSQGRPDVTEPGYVAYIQGNMKVYSNVDIVGSTRIIGTVSTGSNLFVGGGISTLGSIGAQGDITTMGNIYAPFGGVIANNLEVRSNATFGGAITFSNAIYVASSITVQNAVSTVQMLTSSLNVQSSINFQEKYIALQNGGLVFSDPITVPSITTNSIVASNFITTSNLTVTDSIDGQSAATFALGSTVITNPSGSLFISSIGATYMTMSNAVTTNDLQTSSMEVSTILLSGNITGFTNGYMNINTVVASTVSTTFLFTENIEAKAFTIDTIQVAQLNVSQELNLNTVSTINASNAIFNIPNGSISTGSFLTGTTLVTSTIKIQDGQIYSPDRPITFSTPTVFMDSVYVSTLSASTFQVSSIVATNIELGTDPDVFFGNYYSILVSTNCVVTGGPGDWPRPYFISNVQPEGIGPGEPYPVNVVFGNRYPPPGDIIPGQAQGGEMTLYPNGELASQLQFCFLACSFGITIYGLYGTNQTQGVGFQAGGSLDPNYPVAQFTGTMYGDSAFSAFFAAGFNQNYSVLSDSNAGITVRNGAIRFPYSLNGVTIDNALNDMSLRTLYYYGGLNFASDPALKENVEPADEGRCLQAIQSLPLRRYKYKDSYLSTFHLSDAHRLGFLATDVEEVFPKSVLYTKLDSLPEFSTIRTIDTNQVEMAHIGATKHLMHRVEELTARVGAALGEISSLKNLLDG
jgi:hypothetical protein